MKIKVRIFKYSVSDSIKKLKLIDWLVIIFFVWGYGRITTSIYRPVLMVLSLPIVLLMGKSLIKVVPEDICIWVYALFLLLFFLQIPFSVESKKALSYFLAYSLYIVPLIMFSYYRNKNLLGRLKTICLLIGAFLTIMCILSLIYYRIHPGIARLHATHRSDMDGLMIGGGYQLAYVCALISPCILKCLCESKRRFKYIILIIIVYLVLWKTTSAITLLAGLIGCGVYVFLSGGPKKRIITISFLGAFIIGFTVFREGIGDFILSISNGKVVTSTSNMNYAIYMRLNEIGQLIRNGNYQNLEALSARVDNFTRPFDSIIHHPIMGALLTTGVNPEWANYNDSSILTAFACWGTPMALTYLFPFFFTIKRYKIFIGTGIAAVVLMLFNPSEGFSVYATCYFLLPSIALLYSDFQKVKNERGCGI